MEKENPPACSKTAQIIKMNSPVEEIKSRLDVVELIQSYIRLHKAGINYKANCPFHGEKTPSFFVSPTRQIWHCFGCGRGGDAFKFVMEIEGHDFPEALRMLALRTGVTLKREDPAIRSERNRLYDLCEEATKVFERSLALTPVVKKYLEGRGLKSETTKEFRLGFAPQSWDFLSRALTQKGFKKEDLEKAGLVIRSEDKKSWYDRFRSRIMFPIADANGRVVGFSGRIFAEVPTRSTAGVTTASPKDQSGAKYINTPQTLIYDKSKVLYGFDKAKQEIRQKNKVVVVEGQMDLVMSHQAGIKNTIAVSGTALTPQQLKTIKRLCDTLISSFDTDAAGESATKRSLTLAAQFEFECLVAVIPSGKDPADAVKENPEAWIEAITQAQPVVEFYFTKALKEKNPKTAAGKKEIATMVLPWMRELSNEIERVHWIKTLADKLGVSEEAVAKELRKENIPAPAVETREEETAKVPRRRDLLEERLLALLPLVGEEVRNSSLQNHYLAFASALHEKLFGLLADGKIATMAEPELLKQIEIFRFKGEVLAQMVTDPVSEFLLCKRELEKECIKERLLELGEEIGQKEKDGNQAAIGVLLQDFRLLSDKLKGFS